MITMEDLSTKKKLVMFATAVSRYIKAEEAKEKKPWKTEIKHVKERRKQVALMVSDVFTYDKTTEGDDDEL